MPVDESSDSPNNSEYRFKGETGDEARKTYDTRSHSRGEK